MEDNKLVEVKVGIFVFLMLLLGGIVIFLIGRESNLFEEQVDLRTSFPTVAGLKSGAPVRLAGLDVGVVTGIEFASDAKEGRINVRLKVRKAVLPRITTESIARIDSRGLLGDKIIDISAEPSGQPIAPGGFIQGAATRGLDAMIKSAEEIMAEAQTAAKRVSDLIGKLGDERMHSDIRETVNSFKNIVKGVEEGKGIAHALLFDEDYTQKLRAMLGNVNRFASGVAGVGSAVSDTVDAAKGIVQGVRGIVDNVKSGDGALHQLIFGKEGKKAIENVAGVIGGIKDIIHQVKGGRGLLHTLLYGEANTNFLNELEAAAKDVRKIVTEVKGGKGTLGALIADPSVYEDLKSILGNVKRNKVLKALIRFAIERDDAKQAGAVSEKPATPPSRSP